MDRLVLFLFLVVAVPFGIYWASHGFENPVDNVTRFGSEVRALGGTRPPPEPTPEPDPEPEPEPDPDPEPEHEPEPEREPEPETPGNAWENGNRLFMEGRFAEAAEAYGTTDAKRRALALLGKAFANAFPEDVPAAPYVVVKTVTGDTYEGFAETRPNSIKLTGPTGKSYTFPDSAIRSRQELDRAGALDRVARNVAAEGATAGVNGPRLFALIQTACRAGRPATAAPLLERALAADEEEPYFLSSVRARVAPAFQSDLFRAFATCQMPTVLTTVRAPKRLGGGARNGEDLPPPPPPKADDPRVRTLLTKADPLRRSGERLYRRIVLAGTDKAKLADIEAAIEALEEAAQLYEKAMAIEDTDAVNAALRSCSKMLFSLRFWEQIKTGK